MSLVLRARRTRDSRHVDAVLSAYADRTLPVATLLAYDRHVAICPRCRGAVDAERRLLSSLRTAATPDVPSRLESALLGLAVQSVAAVPAAQPSRLVVVGRSAPAMHRSPLRAAMLASLAAGASAAAAWSVGVSPALSASSHSLLRAPAAAATAGLSGSTVAGSRRASLAALGSAAGIAASIQLTTAFTAPSPTATPVARSWPAVPHGTALGTIEP
jgi:hypothetical protein